MMNQPGGIMGQQQTPGIQAPAPQAAAPDQLTPAQVAQMLNVSEADVTASLEAGDLKGRRIGSQWRITRAAVDSFLHG
jgi:excisionase family DNA binding protein